MTDLHKAMEQFLTAFAREVAVQVVNELDARTLRYNREREEFFRQAAPSDRTDRPGYHIPRAEFFDASTLKMDKVPGPCPNSNPHTPHTWRFPDSAQARKCPGVQFPEEPCLRTDVHLDHTWEHLAPTEGDPVSLGRWCPGGTLMRAVPSENAERQCPDNLAHHTHRWKSYPWTFNCPGLEYDREVMYCNSRPYAHAAHEWDMDGDGPRFFCKGVREVKPFREPCLILTPHEAHDWQADPNKAAGNLARRCDGVEIEVKRCPRGFLNQHPSHNWEDPGDAHTLKACPGQGPMVPAGPDRHA